MLWPTSREIIAWPPRSEGAPGWKHRWERDEGSKVQTPFLSSNRSYCSPGKDSVPSLVVELSCPEASHYVLAVLNDPTQKKHNTKCNYSTERTKPNLTAFIALIPPPPSASGRPKIILHSSDRRPYARARSKAPTPNQTLPLFPGLPTANPRPFFICPGS